MKKIILPTTVRAIKHFQIVNPVDHNQVKDYAQECEIDIRTLLVDIGLFSDTSNGLVPASQGKGASKYLCEDGSWKAPVVAIPSIIVKSANGVSGKVDNHEIIISLGDITPTNIRSEGEITGKNLSGVNTGDQVITLKGIITGSGTGEIETKLKLHSVGVEELIEIAPKSLLGNSSEIIGQIESVHIGDGLTISNGHLVLDHKFVCVADDPRLSDARTPVGTPLAGIWIGNGTAKQVEITGDVTLDSDGVTTIGSKKITADMLNTDAFNVFCSICDSRLADARTPVGTELPSTYIWVGDGTNHAAPVAVTGDVGISISGNFQLNMESKHVWQSQQVVGQVDLTGSKNIAWNLDTQQNARLLLKGNWFLTNPANMVAGAAYNLVVEQDEIGNRILSFGDLYRGAQILSTLHGAVDILTFYCDGRAMRCVAHTKFNY